MLGACHFWQECGTGLAPGWFSSTPLVRIAGTARGFSGVSPSVLVVLAEIRVRSGFYPTCRGGPFRAGRT